MNHLPAIIDVISMRTKSSGQADIGIEGLTILFKIGYSELIVAKNVARILWFTSKQNTNQIRLACAVNSQKSHPSSRRQKKVEV